jgi:phytoene dehydrogenase-like protein
MCRGVAVYYAVRRFDWPPDLTNCLRKAYDAIVVGSGPNGLAAAIFFAQAGRSVVVLEAAETAGGGTRSAELTLPGFVHDVCSAVHPLAVGSPFLKKLPLAEHGLEWIEPPIPVAHPLNENHAVIVERSVEATAQGLGKDADSYVRLMKPFVENWNTLAESLLAPVRIPRRPFSAARFALNTFRSASGLAHRLFQREPARALFAGMAAHSMLPLEWRPSAAFGLVLGITAHAVGWPVPRGGSQKIADSLVALLRSLGGEVITGFEVKSLDQLPQARAILCDLTPRQLLRIAGDRLTPTFRSALEAYRYGPGVCKVDWALNGPIPWRAPECCRAGTVHLGGTLSEIAVSERAVWQGRHAERPFVLLAQPSLFDSARAPAGKHTAWAYCHVPNGSNTDMTAQIEDQVERFAPGFRDLILDRHTMTSADLDRHNPNLVGGDIGGGANVWLQLFLRPTVRLYRTSSRGLYLCSASTPPGGGVHGMCGYFAAQAALRDCFYTERHKL